MSRVARAHGWLGVGLLAPLLVWALTGLLFHLKPGWSGAYEGLSAFRSDQPIDLTAVRPLADAASAMSGPVAEAFTPETVRAAYGDRAAHIISA